MRTLAIAVLCLAAPALAAETKLKGPEIQTLLADKTLAGADAAHKSEQLFQASGVTYYTVDGAQSQGLWQVRGDQFCSQWPPNEHWSCYDVLVDGETVVFQSSSGKRYAYTRGN